uniref:Uncharacterized protein n=1 Tax=Arundo donax TaxID=35708 RepID=A0A0A8Z7N9_ARUDO
MEGVGEKGPERVGYIERSSPR